MKAMVATHYIYMYARLSYSCYTNAIFHRFTITMLIDHRSGRIYKMYPVNRSYAECMYIEALMAVYELTEHRQNRLNYAPSFLSECLLSDYLTRVSETRNTVNTLFIIERNACYHSCLAIRDYEFVEVSGTDYGEYGHNER